MLAATEEGILDRDIVKSHHRKCVMDGTEYRVADSREYRGICFSARTRNVELKVPCGVGIGDLCWHCWVVQ